MRYLKKAKRTSSKRRLHDVDRGYTARNHNHESLEDLAARLGLGEQPEQPADADSDPTVPLRIP